jgi:hypothetical protein
MTADEKNRLMEFLLQKKNSPSVNCFMTYYLDDKDIAAPALAELLAINDSELTITGKQILDFLEATGKDEEHPFSFENFKKKLHVFVSIQDMLFPPYFTDTTVAETFQIRYFYYESKYILTESILSGLNGLHIGNNALLRSFLEFNITQLYYYNTYIKDQSIRRFRKYLLTGIKPTNPEMIKEAIPNDDFCKPVRKRIQWELKQLSNRFSHPYSQSDSPKKQGIYVPHSSMESVHFYVQATAVLDAVLWMYYVNLPMLFLPVDVFKRFGFDIPPGFFATPSTCAIVEHALPPQDYEIFRDYALKNKMAISNLEWYNSLPDLSDEQIWQTAGDPSEADDTIFTYYVKRMAKMRAQLEMSVELIRRSLAEKESVEIDADQALEAYMNFSKFSQIYTRLK